MNSSFACHRALRRIHFLDILNRSLDSAGVHFIAELPPGADGAAVRSAWERTLRRHASFWMRIPRDGSNAGEWGLADPVPDFTWAGECGDGSEAGIVEAHLRRGFSPGEGRLAMASAWVDSRNRTLMIASFSNLAMDGASIPAFRASFGGFLAAGPGGPPAPTVPPGDDPALRLHALELSARERSGGFPESVAAAWRAASEALDGNPNAAARPGRLPAGTGHVTRFLGTGPSARLEKLSQRLGIDPSEALFALFCISLSRYLCAESLPIGVPHSKRPFPGMEDAVGFFVDIGRVVADVDLAESFAAWAPRLAADLRSCLHQAGYDLEDFPGSPSGAAKPAPFRILFDSAPEDLPEHAKGGLRAVRDPGLPSRLLQELGMRQAEGGEWISIRFNADVQDLLVNLSVRRTEGNHCLSLLYSLPAFGEAKARGCLSLLDHLLDQAHSDPGVPMHRWDLLPPGESAALEAFSAGETVPLPPEPTVHALFKARVREYPDRIAVLQDGAGIPYGRLDAESDRWAGWMSARRIGPGSLVGLVMRPGYAFIRAALAVLKCGAAYVPLDAGQPEERRDSLLRFCGAALVLHDGSAVPSAGPPWMDARDLPEAGPASPAPAGSGESLCYVIFTSGTTGAPKGIAVPHRAAINAIEASIGRYASCRTNTNLFNSSIGFDSSFGKVFQCLLSGGTVVVPAADGSDGTIWELLRRHSVSRFGASPSELALLDRDPPDVPSLQVIGSAGERLMKYQVKNLSEMYRVINIYGPSETTVSCACWMGDMASLPDHAQVPIGRPIRNYTLRVIDRRGLELPLGVIGEIAIGGIGLSLGYLGNPELTAERFREHPREPGRLEYRSGDWGRWDGDGNLVFEGRRDSEVKLRGQRIDLGEVEEALYKASGTSEVAACIVGEGPDATLIGYYCREGLQEQDLRAALFRHLPASWIPARILPLPRLPRTLNGKVDAKALAAFPLPPPPGSGELDSPLLLAIGSIWGEFLGPVKVGPETDFFMAGGNSLSAAQMAATVEDIYAAPLPLREFLAWPTPACLERLLSARLPDREYLDLVSELVLQVASEAAATAPGARP